MAKPVPEGTHTVTPYLVVRGAAKAIEFYKKAFGAQERLRMPVPGGKLGHAELTVGESVIMLADEFPMSDTHSPKALGGTTVSVHLYVEDVDALWKQATAAGAKVTMPLMDAFWGDRFGKVRDPFGHTWSLATHKEDLTPEEMARRGEAAMAAMPKPPAARKKAARKKPAGRAKKGGKTSRKKRR